MFTIFISHILVLLLLFFGVDLVKFLGLDFACCIDDIDAVYVLGTRDALFC